MFALLCFLIIEIYIYIERFYIIIQGDTSLTLYLCELTEHL